MNEKAYKTMGGAGACSLVLGILLVITGLTSGILMIVSGTRLLKTRSDLIF